MWPGHCRWPERRIKHSIAEQRGDPAGIYIQIYIYISVYIELCCHGPQRQWTKIITTNGLLRENAASKVGERAVRAVDGGWRLGHRNWRMAW